MFGRNVFVIKGDHIHLTSKRLKRWIVRVIADRVGRRRGRRDILGLGQDMQFQTQINRDRGHHTGQLAAAYYTYCWKTHPSTVAWIFGPRGVSRSQAMASGGYRSLRWFL